MLTTLSTICRRLFGARAHHVEQIILFGFVGGVGTVVNTAILWALTTFTGMHYLFAAAVATEVAILSNFAGNHLLTFRHSKDSAPIGRKLLNFQAVSMVALIATLTILWALTTAFGEELLLVWNLIAILGAFGLNFLLNRRYTWRDARTARHATKPRARHT